MKTISKRKFAIILGSLTALGPLCTDFYLPALPDVASHLNASTAQSQLTLTASLLGLGAGQLVFGPVSDRIGRIRPLLVSLLLFCLASVWCASSTDIYQLIAARLLQGLAGAGGAVLARAIARDNFSGLALTSFFTLLMTINGIAPVIAPLLGGWQLTVTGWRGLFVTLALAGLVFMAITRIGLQESLQSTSRFDQSSLLMSFVSVLRHRKFMRLCLTQGFMMAGLFAYIGASSYVLQGQYHLTPQEYSYTFAFNGVGLALFALIPARLSKRWGEQRVLKMSLILASSFAMALLVCGLFSAGLLLVLTLLFFTISFNSVICTISSSMALQLHGTNAGSASACIGTIMFMMGGISAPLTGIGGTSLLSMALVMFVAYLMALLTGMQITTFRKS